MLLFYLSLIYLAINQSHEKFGSIFYFKFGLVVATVKKVAPGCSATARRRPG